MTWSVVNTELDAQPPEVADRTPRVHPLPSCSAIYESVIDRTRPVRMLEMGSFYGDSVTRWRDFLHPDSLVVGIDIDSKFVSIADSRRRHVRICGEQGDSLLSDVAAEFGPFDVIVDARSHASSHIVNSFRRLFDGALNDHGTYLIQDVYFDRWTLYSSFSPADLGSGLVDLLHGHYRVATSVANFHSGHIVVVRREAQV